MVGRCSGPKCLRSAWRDAISTFSKYFGFLLLHHVFSCIAPNLNAINLKACCRYASSPDNAQPVDVLTSTLTAHNASIYVSYTSRSKACFRAVVLILDGHCLCISSAYETLRRFAIHVPSCPCEHGVQGFCWESAEAMDLRGTQQSLGNARKRHPVCVYL